MKHLVLIVLALSACRKKRAPVLDVSAAVAPPTTPLPSDAAVGDAPAPETGADAVVNVKVTVNGKPLNNWQACSVAAYEPDSNLAVKARTDCAKALQFAPGAADLVLRLRAGTLEHTVRLPTQTFSKGLQRQPVEVTWRVGRMKITRTPHPRVEGCRVAIAGVNGDPEADWVVAPAGRYTATFTCKDKDGVPFTVDGGVESIDDSDNAMSVAITPPSETPGVGRRIPGIPPNVPLPSTPATSEQFPITKDYVEVPPTPGTDLKAPAEAALPPPRERDLAPPAGQTLPPATRENP